MLSFSLAACSTAPVVADLRPAYEAARAAALTEMLRCDDVSEMECQCRREGLEQEFSNPSPARWDLGYTALVEYRDDPAHKGHTEAQAESHAVRVIFSAIASDVENICGYYDE